MKRRTFLKFVGLYTLIPAEILKGLPELVESVPNDYVWIRYKDPVIGVDLAEGLGTTVVSAWNGERWIILS